MKSSSADSASLDSRKQASSKIHISKIKRYIFWIFIIPILFYVILIPYGYIVQRNYIKSMTDILRKISLSDKNNLNQIKMPKDESEPSVYYIDRNVVIITQTRKSSSIPLRLIQRHSTLAKFRDGRIFLLTNKKAAPPYTIYPFFIPLNFFRAGNLIGSNSPTLFDDCAFIENYKLIDIK